MMKASSLANLSFLCKSQAKGLISSLGNKSQIFLQGTFGTQPRLSEMKTRFSNLQNRAFPLRAAKICGYYAFLSGFLTIQTLLMWLSYLMGQYHGVSAASRDAQYISEMRHKIEELNLGETLY